MKGAMGEVDAKITRSPKIKRTRIMGVNHHHLCCQKKASNSPMMPNRTAKLSIQRIHLLDHHKGFSIIQSPKTRASIPLLLKVLKASRGVFTIGSPLRLNEVFKITGTPVACPNVSMSL